MLRCLGATTQISQQRGITKNSYVDAHYYPIPDRRGISMSNYVRPGVKPVYKIRTVGSNFLLDKAMPHVAAAIEAQIDCDDAGDDFVKEKLHSNIHSSSTDFDDLAVAAEVRRVRFGSKPVKLRASKCFPVCP